nr:glycosyltransferase family 4 protein [Clostridium caldaquaticum]
MKFHVEVDALIPNGINFDEFYNNNKIYNREKVILMLYHKLEWKGYNDGIKAIEIVKKIHPEIKVRLFGLEKGTDIPSYAEFYENPEKSKLRELYSTSDIFISPSWTEGWHLPPMEAMACKCAVVATNVGCIPDIGIHRETSMVCEPHDIESLAQNILSLIENENLLRKISENGYKLIKTYTWNNSTDIFENTLKK